MVLCELYHETQVALLLLDILAWPECLLNQTASGNYYQKISLIFSKLVE